MPLSQLSRDDRLRLIRFVCSFAWADLEVESRERKLIARMVRALRLDAGERQQVERWLATPPPPEELDPASVPREHRALFIDAIKAVIVADGKVRPEELENLALLDELLQ